MQVEVLQRMTNGQVESQLSSIPGGPDGVAATLRNMRANVLAASHHPLIGQLARTIVAKVKAYDTTGEARAVQQWVQRNIRYTRDPSNAELIQSPEVTLRLKQGDCDDQTQLVCALLMSVGHTVRMVAVGFKPGVFAHVLSQDLIGGKWTAVETIRPWGLGVMPPNVQAQMVATMGANDQIAGIFKKLKKAAKKVVKVATKPSGLLAIGTAIATGGASILPTAVAAVSKIATPKPGALQPMDEPVMLDPVTVTAVRHTGMTPPVPYEDDEEEEVPFYRQPAVLIGGGVLFAGGLLALAATRNRKR